MWAGFLNTSYMMTFSRIHVDSHQVCPRSFFSVLHMKMQQKTEEETKRGRCRAKHVKAQCPQEVKQLFYVML